MTETQQGIADAFATFGQIVASFNQKGEAFSFTVNITSCPDKGPIVSVVSAPGTTQKHADALRDAVAGALLGFKG